MTDRNDSDALYYQEQQREIEDALLRVETGMATSEDAAILRCALGTREKHDDR